MSDLVDSVPEEAVNQVLPPPFAWCSIPGGSVTVGYFGTATVAPFLMAKYPVTVDQFDVFLRADDGYLDDQWWIDLATRDQRKMDQAPRNGRLPQVHVTWYECIAYCRWLSARLGRLVRLPTDWEWQWAASGSSITDLYPWGAQFRSSRCNTKESGLATVTPVDRYPEGASRFGVVDLCGNVWERCLGVYGDPVDVSVTGNRNRTLRGGSWRYSRAEATVVHRQVCLADRHFNDGGFRVIMTSETHMPERVDVHLPPR